MVVLTCCDTEQIVMFVLFGVLGILLIAVWHFSFLKPLKVNGCCWFENKIKFLIKKLNLLIKSLFLT